MTRLAVAEVLVTEGSTYVRNTEDGPVSDWDLFVVAVALDGREFVHPHSFWRFRPDDAEALRARVERLGSIDPELWRELEPRPSLEERFDAYAQAEMEVRWGLRHEADLYAGCP